MFVLELYLDLPGVLPLASAQEQSALTRTLLYLHVSVIEQLFSFSVPLDLNGILANKLHFEHGVLSRFNLHSLGENTEVFSFESGGILKKNKKTVGMVS